MVLKNGTGRIYVRALLGLPCEVTVRHSSTQLVMARCERLEERRLDWPTVRPSTFSEIGVRVKTSRLINK